MISDVGRAVSRSFFALSAVTPHPSNLPRPCDHP